MSTTNASSEAPLEGGRRGLLRRRPAAGTPAAAARDRRRSKQRRRLANVAGLMAALVLTGVGYSAFAPGAIAADEQSDTESIAVEAGRELYVLSCITCHGSNLQGVEDRGPSLIGVGSASVYFQVSTGRMPLVRQEAQAPEHPVIFTEAEIAQLMAYVQANGGGPSVPSGDLRDGELAEGGELFRLNCASCHNFVGEGGALSSGKRAPSLDGLTDEQIYAAMLTGPENMPVFGDNQLTPEEKRSVIDYVQTIQDQADPGGAPIGRAGPVAEGLVIWVAGVGALLFGIFWMGTKA
ncbi:MULTISPECIES: cytochrome bc1 complex diheme cytochrome c subunit [unclassified Modestobacter]|uniref:cytochrome bc1 complex diheme cytochrome c subunit n=1 Tax=unclassified Modestobacter TaxID=2643866 RepID=UPI0022AA0AE7|nr:MULTISPECIES: cytochrome c [unclassified Modestobacter]MCZ2824759.1 cytochrome c [Modestobacter sp. VKM Ac-2981]MCZ2854738.1 cytochrome c [Modestobacter sp. VKM Ac-2982]